jgi:hypothetical protein
MFGVKGYRAVAWLVDMQRSPARRTKIRSRGIRVAAERARYLRCRGHVYASVNSR